VSFVLDASVTMAWCFEADATPYTDHVLDRMELGEQAWVPVLWRLEVVNALLKAKRQRRISTERAKQFLHEMRDFTIEVDHECLDIADGEIFQLGLRHQLSSYDAAYLELAIRRRLPLASNDNNLILAAKASSVTLVESGP
jgi:predicted nucleic acid-binding protein